MFVVEKSKDRETERGAVGARHIVTDTEPLKLPRELVGVEGVAIRGFAGIDPVSREIEEALGRWVPGLVRSKGHEVRAFSRSGALISQGDGSAAAELEHLGNGAFDCAPYLVLTRREGVD
jgi:hypothetical protein